jgi:hypothetical protein
MLGSRRRQWFAIAIAVLSSTATPLAGLAHGHAHADAATHEAVARVNQGDGVARVSPADHGGDHSHGTVGVGLRSLETTLWVQVAVPVRIEWTIAPVAGACVARSWDLPCSAAPPPSASRAPPRFV